MNYKYNTKSLVLRVCSRRDARMVHRFYMDNFSDFMRYEPLDPQSASSLKYYERLLDIECDLISQHRLVRFFLFEKHDPFNIVGTISFRNIEAAPHLSCAQIGYKIDAEKRRRGYATQAIITGCRLMYEEMNIHRIEALIMHDNIPSRKLAESLGFVREGLLRKKIRLNGIWQDHYLYARTQGL